MRRSPLLHDVTELAWVVLLIDVIVLLTGLLIATYVGRPALLLAGAFAGALGASVSHSLGVGVLSALVAGGLMGALLAVFAIRYLVNQVVLGVVGAAFPDLQRAGARREVLTFAAIAGSLLVAFVAVLVLNRVGMRLTLNRFSGG